MAGDEPAILVCIWIIQAKKWRVALRPAWLANNYFGKLAKNAQSPTEVKNSSTNKNTWLAYGMRGKRIERIVDISPPQ
jgi:hypothetical protein